VRERDAWCWRWVDEVLWDSRYALRQFRQHPGFTAVAATMLALGIGVNAAVFTVASAVLSRGFRLIDRNDRILYIHSEKNGQYTGVSYPDFQDWRAQVKSFRAVGAAADLKILCDRNGSLEVCFATRISANAFQLLGQQPILGRDFTASDETPGAAPVAILSYGFWERRFGRDPAIVGQALHLGMVDQTLQIGDAPPTTVAAGAPPTIVIGVMPKGFAFPQDQDLWVPLTPTANLRERDARTLWFAFGRLADGVTRETARAELETIGSRLASAHPKTNQGQIPRLENFTEFFTGPGAAVIYEAMWGAVGFVLLIACANLANLLLARAMGRSRELSIRAALGAGRWRIVRQLLIECLALSIIGGAGGWAIARWGVRTYELATNPPVGQWNRNLLDYTMDSSVLAYLMAISIGAGFLFGLAPALRFLRPDLHAVLKDAGASATGGRRGRHLSGGLVISEVALAVVLLGGAGVMIHSFLNMYTADIGAHTANTVEMLLRVPEARYPSRDAQISFYDRLKTRLEAIPGVASASIGLPPAGGVPGRRPYELADDRFVDAQNPPTIAVVTIGPGYFRTLGATVLSGREFNNVDGASGLPAVIVNQWFANQHWPGANALGQRLRLFNGGTPEAWLTVVGVVSNVVYDPRRQEIAPLVYMPYAQRPREGDPWVLVRAAVPVAGVITTLRREVSALDPDVIMWLGPYDLADRLASGGVYGSTRNNTVLLLILAGIALLLASVGLYAVVAHSVSQRTQEIGVRMAVGAAGRDILKLVFTQGMLPVGIGLTIGLAGALAVTPVLKSQLVQVSPTDPVTLVVSSAVLIVSATLGCWVPARRAMRVDPVVALRHE
jgi:putative ABC transport system permease protein